MTGRILIVEDDVSVRDLLTHALTREGLNAQAFEDGDRALEDLRSAEPYDLVILDVMLPGTDGFSICREIRAGNVGSLHKETPVIMLTARDDETSAVVGLELGADDYVTKPFRLRELTSRIRAQLRRGEANGQNHAESRIEVPGLTVDLLRRQVIREGLPVELTATEFEVLSLLASHPGWVYERRQIMDHLWEGAFFGTLRSADVHIQHIREKIEPEPKKPRYIQTVRAIGYKFTEF